MNKISLVATCSVAMLTAACGPRERVSFSAGPQQQEIVRDGRNTIMSKKKNSTVVISPASRELASGTRPVFVVGIQNNGKTPQTFHVADVSAMQLQAGSPSRPMAVIPYEKLASEERTRQVVGAVLAVAAAGANSYAAQRNSYTSSGRYSPLAGAINGARADAQNAELIGATVANGELNLAALEQNVMKDNTVMPAEWVGGQLHIEPPASDVAGPKTYVITVPVGSELHEISVTQARSS